MLTDASFFLNFGRLNVFGLKVAESTCLPVVELNPILPRDRRDTDHYTNEELFTHSYLDMSQNFDVYRCEFQQLLSC